MLTTCRSSVLIFDSAKFQFGQESVEFAKMDVII